MAIHKLNAERKGNLRLIDRRYLHNAHEKNWSFATSSLGQVELVSEKWVCD